MNGICALLMVVTMVAICAVAECFRLVAAVLVVLDKFASQLTNCTDRVREELLTSARNLARLLKT